VRDTLATDRFAAEVRKDEAAARGLGISAVPFFVIDRRFGLAGAQPPEVIGEGLRRAWEARTPLSVVAEGDVCGPDGC
jgi:predicted DsbA family dithiol-disulfide isomerase